ncbi:hypothetical protein EXN66_Car002172 [Channa argus]|uniref:Uncharacterized protein n=1 Tax=Channa argus TaxID=215402 RepID=A0A6G1P875_CHAAH|nr:hypothetical protein EXN66_Car002172 [Channa argus]
MNGVTTELDNNITGGASLWTDRSGVMEETALSCGECTLNAPTRVLICQL